MLEPSVAVQQIESAGFTHIIWVPDSFLGPWESSLVASRHLELIRPCREGEAIAIAAGVMIGGKKPLVVIQCTGLFEAGDALRNVVHDLMLPLKMVVGVRSYKAHAAGKSKDNCAIFTEPILRAWQLPYALIANPDSTNFEPEIKRLATQSGPAALLLGE